MKLTSSNPYWLLRHGIGEVPLPLRRNRRCDVLVVGAGISGALIADRLLERGFEVVMVDKRHPGQGSTSGSTALLQYELDASLAELTDRFGWDAASAAYRACATAVRSMRSLCRDLGEVGFRKRPSLYLASRRRDVDALRQEGQLRRRAGLPSEFWSARQLATKVDFAAAGALWTPLAAEVDPWALTWALIRRGQRQGLEVYGRTEVSALAPDRRGVRVLAGRHTIDARHVVIACGYESERFLPRRRCRLISSYALVTEPVASMARWPGRALIWETARPYTYLRTTTDNRILIGGDDLPFRNPVHRDARLPGKSARLLRRAKQKFPGLDLQMAYSWAGTFGETKDGLPFVGPHPGQSERIHYALGVGGNGIVFSFIAADILAAALTQSAHPLAELFSFNRHGS